MATTSVEENERLVREHFDRVWNQGEFDTDFLADEYRVQTRLGTHEDHTLGEFQDLVASARAAVPDLHKEIDETIATDEKVVVRYTMTGTQEGELKGIPPTGEEVEVAGVAIYRLEDGLIAEEWIIANFLRAFKQLGVLE
ncbi:ester cyclase [Natrinema sp. SYSU A 869]|uniref:ester cyclase n=1 Tax=Natrinema sp. SYSU A 869 TaxID=2871694 RepID=UPI001CA43104|nr:ester cyclase [Natrinema sp. SYSU A 869]